MKAIRIVCETEEGMEHLVSILPCIDDPERAIDVASPDGRVLMCCEGAGGEALSALYEHLLKLGAVEVEAKF